MEWCEARIISDKQQDMVAFYLLTDILDVSLLGKIPHGYFWLSTCIFLVICVIMFWLLKCIFFWVICTIIFGYWLYTFLVVYAIIFGNWSPIIKKTVSEEIIHVCICVYILFTIITIHHDKLSFSFQIPMPLVLPGPTPQSQ